MISIILRWLNHITERILCITVPMQLIFNSLSDRDDSKNNRLSETNIIKITFVIIVIFLCLVFGAIIGSDFNRTRSKLVLIFSFNEQKFLKSFPYQQNATHLWSIRVADENYFRLARLLPCHTVQYIGGPKIDKINSCDNTSTQEFSVENTFKAQKWLYEHQHPINCRNKRFAIIGNFAWSGFGSTFHQIAWAFGMALAENRIAVYQTPGNLFYGDCDLITPDCIFLPITNCSIPTKIDGNQTISINANMGYWSKPIHPPIFQNRTFNWYRTQLLFYLIRYKPETLAYAQKTIAQYFQPPSIDLHHPYIAIYVRRSDKVSSKEMSQAYSLKQYFDLFDHHARLANITKVYINSEDEQVFNEFIQLNKEKQDYYTLLSIKSRKNVIFTSLNRMSREERQRVLLEFLSDLFIEANADLHVGTLTSNWCRLVDEMRLVLGKTIPYYTPENKFFITK